MRIDRRRQPTSRPAFTLIELAIVIGIIGVVVALAAPTWKQVRHQARIVAGMAATEQSGAMLLMYLQDNKEHFPLAKPLMLDAMFNWWQPLVASGHFDSQRDVDPEMVDFAGYPGVIMSGAMACDREIMVPGRTMPNNRAPTTQIRLPDVAMPDRLGMLLRYYQPMHGVTVGGFEWCCAHHGGQAYQHVGPVVFADGSAVAGHWWQFAPYGEIVLENGFGAPAFTPWFGVRGRDR